MLSGRHEIWCMENPVYDLIIGNVSDARLLDKRSQLASQRSRNSTTESKQRKTLSTIKGTQYHH